MSLTHGLTTSVLYYIEYHSQGWCRDPHAEVSPEGLWDIYEAYRKEYRFVRVVKVVTSVAESKHTEFIERFELIHNPTKLMGQYIDPDGAYDKEELME